MHLLAASTTSFAAETEAFDAGQSPADIFVLSAADSELALLARANRGPRLRLANLLNFQHNLSVDLYIQKTLSKAKLIVLRLLGGAGYWPYGLQEIENLARARNIKLAVLPGDANADPALTAHATLPAADCERLRQYLVMGGGENARSFLDYCFYLLDGGAMPEPARELPSAGIYANDANAKAAIIFYRSVIEGGLTAPIDAMLDALRARNLPACAIYVASLKDKPSISLTGEILGRVAPHAILNATSFAATSAGGDDPLARFDCPVLQVTLAGSSEDAWRESKQGLGPRDLAMNVVLPELDGRIHARAVSFKSATVWDDATQCRIATYQPVHDRIDFAADLAANWAKLRRMPRSERKIAIVLANYPNKAGRIANGVGYDTPQSTINVLEALEETGYAVADIPANGNVLITQLHPSPVGERWTSRSGRLSEAAYITLFAALPETLRTQTNERWGDHARDPMFRDNAFHFRTAQQGNIVTAIQPSRGYDIDPKATYHDPALVPPHGYIAFYFWLRHEFGAHAVIHNGKHGNLEWLPGKATALSAECWPEAVFGPLPQLYPFIVNDPGEGTQAKRRTSAVIIDHLTPPLTRAETYGPLKDLEALVDEYYIASGLDHRRRDQLRLDILDLSKRHRLDADAGFTGDEDNNLQKLDAYLCDLKEAQIRDGLHILGQSPEGRLETDLLVALTRVPRGLGEGGDQSLIRALAKDFGFEGFDPLSCAMEEPWTGPRPGALASLSPDPWRTNGDTVERLELFASLLVSSVPRNQEPMENKGSVLQHGSDSSILGSPWVSAFAGMTEEGFERTRTVLTHIEKSIRPALRSSGTNEIANLLRGLDGKRIPPGPSGAPTRGRLDVLPTGRNFYSIDNRTLPTPTAWNLGKKSAEDLLIRHFQDFGRYPKALGLSAWGTANMRTGGDDIAQALAFIGAKPVWEPSSWRVTGIEVIPLAALGRPRIDVTMRISGFFRDAFPAQIELLDRAFRTIGGLEEDEEDNPIAARMKSEAKLLETRGIDGKEARQIAGYRIFGSKPGAYGAGLQALIDEKIWNERADLAAAYVTWGAYAYGAREAGVNDEAAFSERLKRIEAVVHNQDNREHDLLDSDDYYQFEGGMSAAVEQASGKRPRVYHNDHSRSERPIIRTLEEEVGRVVRSRVVNPKWIDGVKRHAYKGAFEIAATIDYMFAFAATTGAVKSHHFDLAYNAFLADGETRDFIAINNPAALKEIAQRFDEAAARGFWTPRLNSAYDLIRELSA
ncbi:MAG: cobaltochelatase subunit CobN [Aestuariivirga sp.]